MNGILKDFVYRKNRFYLSKKSINQLIFRKDLNIRKNIIKLITKKFFKIKVKKMDIADTKFEFCKEIEIIFDIMCECGNTMYVREMSDKHQWYTFQCPLCNHIITISNIEIK